MASQQAALTADGRFQALKQGDHVCAVYSSPEEQADAMVQYMVRGLNDGERCLYIVDDRAATDILERLRAGGVEVGGALDSKRLTLASSRETYLRNGTFDPDAMIRLLDGSQQRALADGCTGLRITGEMTWALGSDIWSERLLDYETKLNEFFPGSRSHAICQYNRSRFSPAVIRDVLKTHPIALVGQYACPNPYYEPPHLIAADDGSASYVEWMIRHLLTVRRNELELQQMVQERDHFLSVASHELRTPLNALTLTIQALKQMVPMEPIGKDLLGRAERQLGRLGHLVNTLLDVSRLNEQRLRLEVEPTNLMDVAMDVVTNFAAEARAARSEIELEGESLCGEWDRERVEQILSNLLGNALKYGAGRPVRISVRCEAGFAAIVVEDQGIGIPSDQQERIFERFTRATSSKHYSGLGLGLWITRCLVQAMGGRIAVQSTPGKGSAFTVHLPLDTDARTFH